uniref:Transposase n=1 Tax=Globisporangium ultimum (strain ATCC 200006 / CBS 805.95 / DAOM BR144) TaxID=431595 RepID=K3WN18_GLOUD
MIKPFRKLKLRSYIFAQKKLRELCLKLTAQGGRRTIVGFGDWSNQDIGGLIKKCPAGPVKPLERMLRKYCRVESIDEFRTSKLHNDCHRSLDHQYSKRKCRDGKERTLKVHGVLHCKNNGCHGMTVNRDVNASKNMLLLLQLKMRGEDRPPAFCRASTQEEQQQVSTSAVL